MDILRFSFSVFRWERGGIWGGEWHMMCSWHHNKGGGRCQLKVNICMVWHGVVGFGLVSFGLKNFIGVFYLLFVISVLLFFLTSLGIETQPSCPSCHETYSALPESRLALPSHLHSLQSAIASITLFFNPHFVKRNRSEHFYLFLWAECLWTRT